MKKILTLGFIALISMFIPAYAAHIEVLPAMSANVNSQNRVWAGTFQVAWNELIDKYVHMPIRFREGTPAVVKELNLKRFTLWDLTDKCYYKFSGNVSNNTKKNISKAIKKQFGETSDLLDDLNLTPGLNNFLIYVMLKKDFEFINAFDKLGKSKFGKDAVAEYFGINNSSDSMLRHDISVLFYNNQSDFAIKIAAKGNDEVYLYKTGNNKNFSTLYKDMNTKKQFYKGDILFSENDELKIPNLKFDTFKIFDEFADKRIMGTNLVINQAMETIKFNMDNKGVQLKSEAAINVKDTGLQDVIIKPRYFNFDDTFVMFLKEKEKTNPYFALRVNDIDLFQ